MHDSRLHHINRSSNYKRSEFIGRGRARDTYTGVVELMEKSKELDGEELDPTCSSSAAGISMTSLIGKGMARFWSENNTKELYNDLSLRFQGLTAGRAAKLLIGLIS